MKIVLFLLFFNRVLSTTVKCADGKFYQGGNVVNVPTIDSSTGCRLSIFSAVPCTVDSVTMMGTVNIPGAGCNYSVCISFNCQGDLCNQDLATIYALLTTNLPTTALNGQAVIQCGLLVLQEKYGYSPNTTTTNFETESTTEITKIGAKQSTPAGITTGGNFENEETPTDEFTSTISAKSRNDKKDKCMKGRTTSSQLYIWVGCFGGVMLILILIIAWFVVIYRRVTKTMKHQESQITTMRADNLQWRQKLGSFRQMVDRLEKKTEQSNMSSIVDVKSTPVPVIKTKK